MDQIKLDSHLRRNILLTVAGERFSSYGIKALLILYLVKVLSMSDIKAGQFFGTFDGLVSTTPMLGGYLADRYLGHQRSIVLGCILMTVGQIFLCYAQIGQLMFGLLIFILGAGLFDPSVTAILGWLPVKESKHKENAYMLYVIAINVGALAATLVCAWIATYYSWTAAFMTASLGTLAGIILMIFTRLPEHVKEQAHAAKRKKSFSALSSQDEGRIATILALAFFSVLYMVPYEQAWSSLMIFADRYTDRHIFGYEFPAPYFQVIDPAIVIVLGLFFVRFFRDLGKRGDKPAEILKLATGFVLLSACYAILVIGMLVVFGEGHELKLGSSWVIIAVLLSTISQFFFIPIGLSLISKLAPQGYSGLMMGFWMLSFGIANYISGALVGFMGKSAVDLELFFAAFALLCALVVAILLTINKRFQGHINSYFAAD